MYTYLNFIGAVNLWKMCSHCTHNYNGSVILQLDVHGIEKQIKLIIIIIFWIEVIDSWVNSSGGIEVVGLCIHVEGMIIYLLTDINV